MRMNLLLGAAGDHHLTSQPCRTHRNLALHQRSIQLCVIYNRTISHRAESPLCPRVRPRTVAQPALFFCLLLPATPLVGQDEQELSQALIEQRIATLRDAGTSETDETLRAYEAAQTWLTRASAHAHDAAMTWAQRRKRVFNRSAFGSTLRFAAVAPAP